MGKQIKVIHLSTAVGNNSANTRLHLALLKAGVDSKILVLDKGSTEISELYEVKKTYIEVLKRKLGWRIEQLKLQIRYPKREKVAFSTAKYGIDLTKDERIKSADIIHLHWINNGFLSMVSFEKLFNIGKPIVWTVHDSWPFTGGCHVRYGCSQFKKDCGKCRILNSDNKKDCTYKLLQQKKKIFKRKDIIFIAPSRWMETNIRSSALFQNYYCKCIPNPIDIDQYRPMDKNELQQKYGVKKNKYQILFGAVDAVNCPYKGFDYLCNALYMLKEKEPQIMNQVVLNIFGNEALEIPELSGFEVRFWGMISDADRLAELYNLADIYILPSLDDNLPNTIMESLACGTPVLAYATGGIPDMIVHKVNGYLAEYKNVEDLCNGLLWIYKNNNENIKQNARKSVETRYNEKIIAKEYIKIYKECIDIEKE